jgi:hypothetical protein
MTVYHKPTPKTQKEISNSLIDPYDKVYGNPNNSIPDPKNRALQESWKDDTVKPISIGLEDIDEAVFYYLENIIKPTIIQNDESLPVPVIYASPEKWKSYQKDGYYRDNKGSIMAPLIAFKKDNINRNRMLSNKLDSNVPHNYNVSYKKYSQRNSYDNFNILNNRKPEEQIYAVVIPDYVTVNYKFVVFTYYTDQLNKIVESINYAADSYWGNPERFKFQAMIDSFGFQSELNETNERIVRSTFDIKLNGYIVPNNIQKNNTAVFKINSTTKNVIMLEGTGRL